jgi:hypothetical protein
VGAGALGEFCGSDGLGIGHGFIKAQSVAEQYKNRVHGRSHVANCLAHELLEFLHVDRRSDVVERRSGVGGAHDVFSFSLMILLGLLVVFFFLLFPTFRRFAGAILQLTPGSGGGLFGVLGHFMGGFANFICRGASVAFFSFPLCFPLALAGAGAGAQAQQGQ